MGKAKGMKQALWERGLWKEGMLVEIDDALIRALIEAESLIDWLRGTPGDTDFSSSVEIGMGRSEMECPDELWNSEKKVRAQQ